MLEVINFTIAPTHIHNTACSMTDAFYEKPILNSPYQYPKRHWELDGTGQPTQQLIETRRRAEFITPIPKDGLNNSQRSRVADR